MTAFGELSAFVRALFALWALLLCLTNAGSMVLAAVRKRYHFSAGALAFFVPVYLLWQVIFDYSLLAGTDKLVGITVSLTSLAWGYWLAAFLVLSAATALLLAYNVRYDRTFITPGAIKLYLDKIPCGICCWQENGRVLFSNVCMSELCRVFTGAPLLNGNQFRDAVKAGILSADGKVWRFACREILLDGERLYEMIASDITSEYAKTRALEEDKEELSRLNQELWEYYLSIDESVQRQEILQAKMNIHDEMNRLMLSTVAADTEDTQALDRIFSLWEQNALLLCMEAGKKDESQQTDSLDMLADALGIRLVWQSELPAALSAEQRGLFFSAAREAIANAVKHARADTMTIAFTQTREQLCACFTNGGKMPAREVRFEGGLKNIATLAAKQGASVSTQVGETFTLCLCFPVCEKNQPNG